MNRIYDRQLKIKRIRVCQIDTVGWYIISKHAGDLLCLYIIYYITCMREYIYNNFERD